MNKQETLKQDVTDVKGWKISAGTTIHIIKESTIKNPMTGKTELWKVVKIDNGTGDLSLMPETAFKEEK